MREFLESLSPLSVAETNHETAQVIGACSPRRLRSFLGAATVCLAALCGCEKGLHEMYDQAKYKPLTPTQLFEDGNSSRPQVPGSVPTPAARWRGAAAAATPGIPAGGVAEHRAPIRCHQRNCFLSAGASDSISFARHATAAQATATA